MSLDFKRILMIDRRNNVSLVRGCAPVINGCFAYDDIKKALGIVKDPDKLIVVNLMDNTGERSIWEVDLKKFAVNPDEFQISCWPPYINVKSWAPEKPISVTQTGALYWWPIEGLGPDQNTFLKAPGWDFSGCVDLVDSLMNSPGNVMVYFHCMLGADRTGALHAGYLIKRGRSVDDALGIASNCTNAGSPSMPYVNLVKAYGSLKSTGS